jgi:hypothetical protein
MIDRAYVQCMARYNRCQNENLYGVTDAMPAEERRDLPLMPESPT